MKKIILTATLLAAYGATAFAQNTTAAPAAMASKSPMDNLGISATLDYESQYVFRGKKVTNSAFQPNIKFTYPVYGGSAYVTMWNNDPIGRAGVGPGPNEHDEIDLGGGYTYPLDMITKSLSADVGYLYYWYPDVGGQVSAPSYNEEVHLGVSYDTSTIIPYNLNPTLYYYHDFILDQNDFEFNVSYTWDLSSLVGLKGVSLVPAGTLGWLGGNHESGGQTSWPLPRVGGAHQQWRNSYIYYMLQLNLNYALSDSFTAFAGVRYSGNNDGTAAVPVGISAQSPGTANSIWGGVGLTYTK